MPSLKFSWIASKLPGRIPRSTAGIFGASTAQVCQDFRRDRFVNCSGFVFQKLPIWGKQSLEHWQLRFDRLGRDALASIVGLGLGLTHNLDLQVVQLNCSLYWAENTLFHNLGCTSNHVFPQNSGVWFFRHTQEEKERRHKKGGPFKAEPAVSWSPDPTLGIGDCHSEACTSEARTPFGRRTEAADLGARGGLVLYC